MPPRHSLLGYLIPWSMGFAHYSMGQLLHASIESPVLFQNILTHHSQLFLPQLQTCTNDPNIHLNGNEKPFPMNNHDQYHYQQRFGIDQNDNRLHNDERNGISMLDVENVRADSNASRSKTKPKQFNSWKWTF